MSLPRVILILVACLLLAATPPAVAGVSKLITSKNVKNGSLAEKDFNKKVKAKLNKTGLPGPTGPQGDAGTDGIDGTDGADGEAGVDGVDGADGADGLDGEDGARGPKGDTGPQGAPGRDGRDSTVPGPQGPAGVSGHTIKSGDLILLADAGPRTITIDCPSGKVPTGGGSRLQEGEATVTGSYPEGTGWAVQFDSPGGAQVRLYVVCVSA